MTPPRCAACDGAMPRLGPVRHVTQACPTGRCAIRHPVTVVEYECPHGLVQVAACACRGCEGEWGYCPVTQRHERYLTGERA